jgi:bifunctional DNA-binding transcriptional regulator/antitoxin component of YhaV-PrlF toxin-antitoxin module
MSTTQTTPVETGNRIQLPAEWAEAFGLQGHVILERTDNGILVRPCPRFTWDVVFATRLSVRPGDPAAAPAVTEVTGDDLLF